MSAMVAGVLGVVSSEDEVGANRVGLVARAAGSAPAGTLPVPEAETLGWPTGEVTAGPAVGRRGCLLAADCEAECAATTVTAAAGAAVIRHPRTANSPLISATLIDGSLDVLAVEDP
jgi:hypothetical protein